MNLHQEETIFALLWSGSQNTFHVEPLKTMLTKNRRACLLGNGTDYVLIFLGSDDQCRQARRFLCAHRERIEGNPLPVSAGSSEAKSAGDLCDAFMVDLLERMANHHGA